MRRCGPDEWPFVGVVGADLVVDSVYQIFAALKRALADGLLGDEPEPAFHLVEPGRVGWCEVDMVARPCSQPGSDFEVLVGGVIVADQMNLQVGRDVAIYVAEKGRKLLMAMPGFALGDHLAGGRIQRGT